MNRAHIVGAGLIGTSIGLALSRSGGWLVTFEDLDSGRAATAAAMCAKVSGAVPGSGAADEPDLVVVAVPPRATAQVCADALQRFGSATVTDVCSVKAQVTASLADVGADLSRFVGGHPMGGREVSGPESARADLLDDRVWVLTPTLATLEGSLQAVRDLVRACRAVPVELDAQVHDDAVAVTSHVPQVLSSALATLLLDLDAEQVRVSGQGLRDMTRIAASDPVLWAQILSSNARPVADALSTVAQRLNALAEALRSDEPGSGTSTAADLITLGRQGRDRIPGKHGGLSADFDVVSVLIADEPGALAEVFVAAGSAGFNLEDVRIDHVLGRPSGLVEVSVRPGLGGALAAALAERGFDVRG